MLAQETDWTALPPELIRIISNKLPDLLDFIRFRAACKTWRSSSDPPPQLPWLLELPEEKYDCICERQRFYSVSSCQTLTIRLPTSKSFEWQTVKGVFSHYLPFVDCEDKLSFFNPLTQDQFSLPWPHSGPYVPRMVWTGTDAICNRSIVLVEMNGWACYDPHSNKWVEQEGIYGDCCYWQGMFFSTYVTGETEVFDASSKKLLLNIPPPEDEVSQNNWFFKGDLAHSQRKSYLVESLGIILRVSWVYDIGQNEIVEDSIFHIYRLEFDGDGQLYWIRVDNIGNQILFLEESTGFSMTARPSTGFREGCIYFINPFEDKPYVYDILTGTIERVPCPFERCTWFLPSLC